jgi:hypothetical protein
VTLSLTPRDRVVLMTLMALNEEVSNPELKRRAGLDLDKPARERLNQLQLVKSTPRGRTSWHELTEAGWAWCWDEMTRSAPPRADGGTRGLYVVLAALHRYLDSADLRLSDVFGSVPQPLLEDRIREAYAQLAAEPYDWVPLAGVRGLLIDVPSEAVDETLRWMESLPDVHLVPETDQRRLGPADRAAAVRIGGKDKHLLRIG